MKVTNQMVEGYLTDCLGCDEMMVEELKDTYKSLVRCLSEEELQECVNYYL